MTAATALVAGNDPQPELAVEAIRQALESSGLAHATGVLLLLSADFAKVAAPTLLAVSRAAQCLQVAGGIVGGLVTERACVYDRPAAAVMVLGGEASLAAAAPELDGGHAEPLFSMLDSAALPTEWQQGAARFGLLFHDPLNQHPFPAWQQGRAGRDRQAGVALRGVSTRLVAAPGLRLLGAPRRIDAVNAYDLEVVDGVGALDALIRELPPEFRGAAPLPVHQLSLVVVDADEAPSESLHLVPLLAANADRSLTLGERLEVGQRVVWGIRQTLDAERDLQRRIEKIADGPAPEFGLFLSCIGRGPYFYGGEDRDWQIVRQRFPGMPFLGAYGTGQIVPTPTGNLALHNSVVLALFNASSTEPV